MSVTVTENVTTVNATGLDISVQVTENITSVEAGDDPIINISPVETTVQITGDTTSIEVTGDDLSVNITEESVGTKGINLIDEPVTLQFDKTEFSDRDIPALRVQTKNRTHSGKLIEFNDSANTSGTRRSSIGMVSNLTGNSLYIGSGFAGLHFTSINENHQFVIPVDADGVQSNGALYLGSPQTKFRGFYSEYITAFEKLTIGTQVVGIEDFDEGSFNPNVPGATTLIGKYYKINEYVYFEAIWIWSSLPPGVSTVQLSLPFASTTNSYSPLAWHRMALAQGQTTAHGDGHVKVSTGHLYTGALTHAPALGKYFVSGTYRTT